MNLDRARVGRRATENLGLDMLPARHREKVSGFVATALVLTLLSAPTAYTQLNNISELGPAIGASSVPEAGFTVAMPVSGIHDPAVKPLKSGQTHKKHGGM